MSGPVRPPLEVTEVDGSPDGRPINKIVVSNGDLSISGTTATIDTSGAGGTAALTDTYVGFGDSSDLLSGSSKFTWVDTAGSEKLTITGSNTSDTAGTVKIVNTDNSASSAPDIIFYHDRGSGNAANGDYLGQFVFSGRNSANNEAGYVRMFARASNVTSGDEDGQWFMQARVNGTYRSFLRLQGSSGKGYVTFNEDGIDTDFRVEALSTISDLDPANAIKLDGATGYLGLGKATAAAHLHIVGTDEGASSDVIIESSAALGTNPAPGLILWRNSVGADEKWLGEIAFKGQDVDGGDHHYVEMNSYITHPGSTGTPNVNGMLDIDCMRSGTLAQVARFREIGADFNTGKNSGLDFNVRSGSVTNMFFVDAGTDHVGVGCIPTTDDSVILEIQNTTDSAGTETKIRITNDNVSMPNDTAYASIEFYNSDSSGAGVGAEISALSNGSGRGGQLDFLVSSSGGSHTSKMFIDEAGIVTIADTASTDHDNTLGRLQVNVGNSSDHNLTLVSELAAGSDDGPTLDFYRKVDLTDGDYVGELTFSAYEHGTTTRYEYARIRVQVNDDTAGTKDGTIAFFALKGNNELEHMRMGGGAVTVNETQAAINFRVEADASDSLFRCEAQQESRLGGANTGTVAIGKVPDNNQAQFQVNFDASYYRWVIDQKTENHDVTADEAHGGILSMKASATSSRTFTLPETGVIGMHCSFINMSTNGMDIAVNSSSSHKINNGGSAGNSTTAVYTTISQRVDLIYIEANQWVATLGTLASVS